MYEEKPVFQLFQLFGDGLNDVKCPVCDFEYIHLNNRAYSEIYDDNRQTLTIPMYCENGHYWDVVFREREGVLLLEIKNIKEQTPLLEKREEANSANT